MTAARRKCERRARECSARPGKEGQERVKEPQSCGAGFEWRVFETARLKYAGSKPECHGLERAPFFLLPARTRSAGLFLKIFRANQWELLRRKKRPSCRCFCEKLIELFAGAPG